MQEILCKFKIIFRDIEKASKKSPHLKGALEFNKTFITNGINPVYCFIYL